MAVTGSRSSSWFFENLTVNFPHSCKPLLHYYEFRDYLFGQDRLSGKLVSMNYDGSHDWCQCLDKEKVNDGKRSVYELSHFNLCALPVDLNEINNMSHLTRGMENNYRTSKENHIRIYIGLNYK